MHWRCACARSRPAVVGDGPPSRPPWRSSAPRSWPLPPAARPEHLPAWAGRTRRPTTSSPSPTRPTIWASPTRRSRRCSSPRSPTSRCAPARWSFSWVNLAALFAMIVVSLRAVCTALDKRTILWWALALRGAGAAVRPGAPDLPARAGQHHPGADGRGRPDDGPAAAAGDPGRAGGGHQGDADHPDPVPLPHPAGPGRRPGHRLVRGRRLLAVAVNASTSWSYWTHYIRDPQRAGMLSWIGNQGVLGATERMLGHTVTTPTTFVIVRRPSARGSGDRRRRLPPVVARPRAPGGGGHRVAGQPGVVVAPLHLDGAAGGLAGPGRGPAPLRRVVGAGGRRAPLGRAVLVGAARAGVTLRRAGLAASRSATPYVLVFIVLADRGGGPRRALAVARPLRLGRRAMAASGAGS